MARLKPEPAEFNPWWLRAAALGAAAAWLLFFVLVMSLEHFIKDSAKAHAYFMPFMFVSGFPIFDASALSCKDSHSLRAQVIPLLSYSLNGSFWGVIFVAAFRWYKSTAKRVRMSEQQGTSDTERGDFSEDSTHT